MLNTMPLCFAVGGSNNESHCAVSLLEQNYKEWPLQSHAQTTSFVDFLNEEAQKGTVIVSYGGTSFGFKKLAIKLPDFNFKDLVLRHVDLLYLFTVDNGYRAALASFVNMPKGVSDLLLNNTFNVAIKACRDTTTAIYDMYTEATQRGVLMRTAKSGQIFPWFLRQELEQPPIQIPTVDQAKDRPRTIPNWIKEPVSATEAIEWL